MIPNALVGDGEYRAKFPGANVSNTSITPTWLEKFTTAQTPSEQTRWRGNNRGGFSNPVFDRFSEQYINTLESEPRQLLFADILKLASEDVMYIPLYYGFDTIAFRRGIRGPGTNAPIQNGGTWNIDAWEMD